MQNIKLNANTEIDLAKLIDSRLLVQANSGGGKSWVLRRLLEQSHGKVQQIVIDLEGEFSTLREKYDYVLAGKGGDAAAEPRGAALLARRLLELNVSAIIDLYELPHHERKRFVRLFLEAMVNAPKELWHPVMVVLDEAHVFAPEHGRSEALEAVIDMATRGRKRGYCMVLATQRLSKLHKDAAAEMNNKLIGRTGLDVDMKRAADELGFTKAKDAEYNVHSLRTLAAGEFFGFGPAISREVKKIKVGDVKTTHPKAGTRFKIKQIPPTSKIKSLLPKLADLPAEAEKELRTVEELRAEIARLKRLSNNIDPDEWTRNTKVAEMIEHAVKRIRLEQDQERAGMLRQIQNFFKILEDIGKIVNKELAKREDVVGGPAKIDVGAVAAGMKEHHRFMKATRPQEAPIKVNKIEIQYPTVFEKEGAELAEANKPITGSALNILKTLAARYPMQLTKPQLGTFVGIKHSGGSFKTYLSTLRSRGLITNEGGLFSITQEGLDFLGVTPQPPQSSAEVIEMWRNALGNGSIRNIFDLLLENHAGMTREQIAEALNIIPTGGSFKTYLSKLRSNGLITESGGVLKINEDLYL